MDKLKNEDILKTVHELVMKYYGIRTEDFSLMELEKLKDALTFIIKIKQEIKTGVH